MYVYYWIKFLLHLGKVELQHYSIKIQTPWTAFDQKHYSHYQVTKQRETYATIAEELQEMKNLLHKHHEAEADSEICKVEQCGGDIQKMSRPRVSEEQCPVMKTSMLAQTRRKPARTSDQLALSLTEATVSPANGTGSQRVWRDRNTPWVRMRVLLQTYESHHPGMLINQRLPSWHPWRRNWLQCKNTTPGSNADEWSRNPKMLNASSRKRRLSADGTRLGGWTRKIEKE